MAWSVFVVVCALIVCVFHDGCFSVGVFFGTLSVSVYVTKQCGYDGLIYLSAVNYKYSSGF